MRRQHRQIGRPVMQQVLRHRAAVELRDERGGHARIETGELCSGLFQQVAGGGLVARGHVHRSWETSRLGKKESVEAAGECSQSAGGRREHHIEG